MNAFVSLHRLDGESVRHAIVGDNGHVSITLPTGDQLHWDTLADFEAFVDTLHAKVMAEAGKAVAS